MKMFKKLMAVALVAVMALTMLTACGTADTKDVLDEINEKYDAAKIVSDSDLKEDAEKVKKAVEDNIKEDKAEDKIDAAIKKIELDDDEIAFYELTDDAEKAGRNIAKTLDDNEGLVYKTIYIISGSKGIGKDYVCGVASTAEKD